MRTTISAPNALRVVGWILPAVCLYTAGAAHADVWVFEPSVALDQRVDDNYRLDVEDELSVSATRAVGELGISRESASSAIRALLRADALLSVSEEETDELNSNQLAFIETSLIRPRSRWGIKFGVKQDTPNRDISSDLTDISSSASDTGASVTQNQNVDRVRFTLNPNYKYNLSRRTELDFDYGFTSVGHGLLSCEDASRINGQPAGQQNVFTINDELDDYIEHALKVSGRHKLSVRDTFTATVGISRFEAEEEKSEADVDFNDKIPDRSCLDAGGNPYILRNPKEVTSVETTRFSIGYDRAFTETLSGGIQIGYYVANSDKFGEVKESSGYLLSTSLSKNTGLTQYTGRAGVEVYPSDIGDVVESLELVGDVFRKIGPLLDFRFRIRAYEPDALSDEADDDEFARRFLSIEPKLIWRFTRAWTAAGSYRYRRQKNQVDPRSGESNALLFSIKYTPPSAIRDARQNR